MLSFTHRYIFIQKVGKSNILRTAGKSDPQHLAVLTELHISLMEKKELHALPPTAKV